MIASELHPSGDFAAVTPSDAEPIRPSRGLYVGGEGNLRVKTDTGADVTFTNIAAGVIHPIKARFVMATGTTATGIIAAY